MILQDYCQQILQDKFQLASQTITSAKTKSAKYIGWAVIFGIIAIAGIGYVMQGPKVDTARVQGVSISTASASATVTKTASVKVDVSGAVTQPGVKDLQSGDRVEDALRAAGGIAPTADSEYVAMNINLAAKVQDGDKIFIPVKGQAVEASVGAASPVASKTTASSPRGSISGGKISINHASASELDGLPGIGATYAARIISGRPYKSVDDLCSRSDIFRSKSTCDKIRPLVTP